MLDYNIKQSALARGLSSGFNVSLFGLVKPQTDTHDICYGGEKANVPLIKFRWPCAVDFENAPSNPVYHYGDIQERNDPVGAQYIRKLKLACFGYVFYCH